VTDQRDVEQTDFERALSLIREDPSSAEAWKHFYRVAAPLIKGQLFILGERHRERLDDLTHDVLLRFLQYGPWRNDWRTLPTAAAPVRQYLRKVTRSAFVNAQTRHAVRVERAKAAAEVDENLDELEGSTTDLAITLHQLSESLSAGDRLLLQLVIDGRSLPDIADLLGLEYSAAGVRVHRLKSRLYEMVQKRK
jgi:RNA polymerase sigma factor (sigma-70 family)